MSMTIYKLGKVMLKDKIRQMITENWITRQSVPIKIGDVEVTQD